MTKIRAGRVGSIRFSAVEIASIVERAIDFDQPAPHAGPAVHHCHLPRRHGVGIRKVREKGLSIRTGERARRCVCTQRIHHLLRGEIQPIPIGERLVELRPQRRGDFPIDAVVLVNLGAGDVHAA